MAATASKNLQLQIQDDLLKCPICCDQFVNPHVLNCQHTFCLRCIKGCLQNSTGPRNAIKCPVCRKETSLGKSGVGSLSKNLTVAQLIQAMKAGTKPASSSGKSNNNAKKQTSKGCGSGAKKRYSHEAEYKRVYRREYSPSDSSSEETSSSSDDCCSCARRRRCDCCDSSSSYCSTSSSYDETSSDSPLTPEMKKITVRRRGGCCGGGGRGRGGSGRGRARSGCCRR